MSEYMIRNVVFDVGNVIVHWSPERIVRSTFQLWNDVIDVSQRVEILFSNETWKALNLGAISEVDAQGVYRTEYGLSAEETARLFWFIKDTQTLVDGTVDMMHGLKRSGYALYGLTDNVREIVVMLKERYDFWSLFQDVVVSAEVGLLKPDKAIFEFLLSQNDLKPEETVFIDDMPKNVQGARESGLHAIQFESSAACRNAMNRLNIQW